MTSDLGLACNFSDVGLAAGSNHIYPDHMTASITPTLFSYLKILHASTLAFIFVDTIISLFTLLLLQLSLFYLLGYLSTLAHFRKKVLRVVYELLLIKQNA